MRRTDDLARTDPRARRTQGRLEDAWRALKVERPCAAISVAEVAARAEVSRATFYDHFDDLRQLAFSVLRGDLHNALRNRIPAGTPLDVASAEAFSLAAYEFLDRFYASKFAPPADRELPIRTALHETIQAFIAVWLAEAPDAMAAFPGATPDGVALSLSWAVFGGAASWRRLPNRPPVEEAAHAIVAPFFAWPQPSRGVKSVSGFTARQ